MPIGNFLHIIPIEDVIYGFFRLFNVFKAFKQFTAFTAFTAFKQFTAFTAFKQFTAFTAFTAFKQFTAFTSRITHHASRIDTKLTYPSPNANSPCELLTLPRALTPLKSITNPTNRHYTEPDPDHLESDLGLTI
jgi:hypothetical protein